METKTKHILSFLLIAFFCAASAACANHRNRQNEKSGEQVINSSQKNRSEAGKLAEALRKKGISDKRVLTAIGNISRHEFIDENLRDFAYLDRPLPIEKGQTISQPFTVAYQSELLQLKPGEKVLEIGTGSGYQAAVLCEMGADVYSIERHQELHETAKETLRKQGYHPQLFFGDGYEGLPEHAPFDKILITAAPEKVPEKLKQQLKIGGWMVLPLGGRHGQKMTIVKRESETRFTESVHGDFIFVPMVEGTEK
ncbi:MAG: protein-L-isoaspartate(D-aspartate) O-methyltransferase [Bacteroidia bacterium]|nr:protein-L-isoaspartate(D-aspartate) O-methyltransferase [Bacteroidia bacterium]